MALTINGTTGLAGLDGSASSPVYKGTDSNTGFSFGSDVINVNTGGTTNFAFESGQFGVGIASPTAKMHIRGSGFTTFRMDNAANTDKPFKIIYGDQGQVNLTVTQSRELTFGTDNTERMRITTNGRVFVNATSAFDSVSFAKLQLNGDGAAGLAVTGNSTGGQSRVSFFNPNGRVGFINTSGSSTGYNTSSDYRLKENAVAISDGITRLKTLKPYRFNWKTDPSTTVDGFFAHEVTAVPEAVTGEKDGEEMQAIDQSKLVPLLTAALQEAVGKIETLETKVAALEAA